MAEKEHKTVLAQSQAEEKPEEMEFTQEETKNQMRAFEGDIIQGLIAAADFKTDEVKNIEVVRSGVAFFSFRINPLTEEEYNNCKKKHTKYVRNKQIGMKMPGDVDSVKYRDAIIYQATVEEDRNRLWDNKQVWTALNNKGFQIMNGLDVIEYTLRAGEKDRIVEEIDRLSGYEDSNLEEVAKN